MKTALLMSACLLSAACFAERADSRINGKVRSALLDHRSVSGLNTQVDTSSGVVTLRGVADFQAQLELAAEYAAAIAGVKSVVNEMTVKDDPTADVRVTDITPNARNPAAARP